MAPSPRLRTANYTPTARQRLGDAVVAAREAMGFEKGAPFAKYAGVSTRSLWAVENGEPTVGEDNLKKIGRAIAGWNQDTPRLILEGAPIPELPAALRSDNQSAQAVPELVDYTAVIDIATGLPREIVIQIVRAGFDSLPAIRERYGSRVYNESLLKLIKLAELTGQTLDDVLSSDAS